MTRTGAKDASSVAVGRVEAIRRAFGRIYLHDYGYVDVHTESGFIYATGSTLPTGGAMTVTGKDNRGARLTVDSW